MQRGGHSMHAGAVANEHEAMSSPSCDDMSQRVHCRSSLIDAMRSFGRFLS
jgi:hypothetical protein